MDVWREMDGGRAEERGLGREREECTRRTFSVADLERPGMVPPVEELGDFGFQAANVSISLEDPAAGVRNFMSD